MKYYLLPLLFFFEATQAQLPVKALPSADSTKPLVFFATGDGGWTSFSNSFMESLNKSGYPIIALNSRKYFWDKKTPASTAVDLTRLINKYMVQWKRDSVILIGYSFGADIIPFVYNYAGGNFPQKVKRIVLMLPYTTTDFEVHLTEMIGMPTHDSYSVVNEVNKLRKPVLFVLGTEKNQFPVGSLSNKNYLVVTEEGGHHFEDRAAEVAAHVLAQIR